MSGNRYYMIVSIRSGIVAIELEDHGDGADMWSDVEDFVACVGSDSVWTLIDRGEVLDCATSINDCPYGIDCIVRNASDVEDILGWEA